MTWNYRVLKIKTNDGGDYYSIREAYYNGDGSIHSITVEDMEPNGETLEELKQDLNWMLEAINKPVLIDGEIVFKAHNV